MLLSFSQFFAVPGDGNDMEFSDNCASALVPLPLKTAIAARCFDIRLSGLFSEPCEYINEPKNSELDAVVFRNQFLVLTYSEEWRQARLRRTCAAACRDYGW